MKTLNPVVIAKVKENIAAITQVIRRCDIRQQTRDLDLWQEITIPQVGDRVYVYNVDNDEHEGVIATAVEGPGYRVYTVQMDDNVTLEVNPKNLQVLYDRETAHYQKFWRFVKPENILWLRSEEGLKVVSAARFRVYENKQGERIFGTDAETEEEVFLQWVVLLDRARSNGHDLCNV